MGVSDQPNILLVVADQLSARAVPGYGNTVVRAPNLARLGDEGVVFERALCASPLCVPSRASLLTGLLPTRTGAVDNAGELPASLPTFAHVLRARGYRTVLVGKMHFIGPDQLHGFEERPMTDIYPAGLDWIPDWELADDERLPWYHDLSSVLRAGPVESTLQLEYDAEVIERACAVLDDPGPRPLLLVVSFTHPHDPYEVTREHWDRYTDAEIDLPQSPHPADDPPTRRLRAMIGEAEVTEEQLRRARRGYYGAISLVDDQLGALLERAGGDVVVVFTSDHGDMLGERGLWYKMAPFEDSIRVPLIVHSPERFAPQRIAEPVSLLDVAPTIAALGSGALENVDGIDLLAGDPPARDIPIEYLAEGVRAPQVTLVRGARKIIRSYGEPDLIYDLELDPAERVDVRDESLRAAVAARWDLPVLDAALRLGQRRRRLVAEALAQGRVAGWDHPAGTRRYIDTGDDFWTALEQARR